MFFVLRKLGEWQSYEKTIVSFQKTEENMEKQTHISVLSLFVLYLISPFLYEQCAFNSFHIATSAFSLPGTISYMCTAWNLRPGTNFPGTSISATLYCARQEFAPGDKLGPGTGLQVEGVHIQCGGLIGVVGAGYDDMAHPAELVVRPHGLDVQLALVLVVAVQGYDPSLGVVLVVRIHDGHCFAIMMSIVGPLGAHSGARLVGESR